MLKIIKKKQGGKIVFGVALETEKLDYIKNPENSEILRTIKKARNLFKSFLIQASSFIINQGLEIKQKYLKIISDITAGFRKTRRGFCLRKRALQIMLKVICLGPNKVSQRSDAEQNYALISWEKKTKQKSESTTVPDKAQAGHTGLINQPLRMVWSVIIKRGQESLMSWQKTFRQAGLALTGILLKIEKAGKGGLIKIEKKISIIFIVAVIIQLALVSVFFFFMPTTSADELCPVDVDVVLVMDTSGSMADGAAISHCDWWENKWIVDHFEWVKHCDDGNTNNTDGCVSTEVTSGEVTLAWCNDKDLSPHHPSNFSPATQSKMHHAKNSANLFLDNLGPSDQSGLVSFADLAILNNQLSGDHPGTQAAVSSLTTGGATNIGDAIDEGLKELSSTRANPQAVKAMILLTDGKANRPNGPGYGEDPLDVAYAEAKAGEAAGLGYKIFTIGLGSDGDINKVMLQNIANITSAKYYHVPNGNGLAAIYDEIAFEVCQYGSISGCKYNDIDNNNSGEIDQDEDTLENWEIILTGSPNGPASQLTDADGCYVFAGLTDGDYVVTETLQTGWVQTCPTQGLYNVTIADHNNVEDIDFANYLPVCGNEILDADEECDDGVDNGQICEPGYEESCNYCSLFCESIPVDGSYCGDGTVDEGDEECDDSNTSDGDGCSASCAIEAFCGDGNLDAGEECDDGNNDNWDGCSGGCLVEVPEPACGDSNLDPGEDCDDGNNDDGDGCSSVCAIEAYCGDGGLDPSEGCDDGNNDDGDGCDSQCQLEGEPVCGNGVPEGDENCDDGNDNGAYGFCNNDCTGQTQAVCGNGDVEGSEDCDDGNTLNGDGCSAICKAEGIGPGDIVINEIMQNPAKVSDFGGEWFEVYNTTNNNINLDGCAIGDLGSHFHIINNTLIVPAAGYAVLGVSGNLALNGGVNVDYVYSTFFLGDSDDEVIISCNNTEIDRVEYDGGPNFPNPVGASMILAYPSLDNNIGSNWCVSSSAFGKGDLGTPGAENDFCSGVAYCGDGNTDAGEQCDDGENNGTACEPEYGNFCSYCSETCQIINNQGAYCGDGLINSSEECDDGNTEAGDGCSSQCLIEISEPVCGDGAVDAGEECDDGNTEAGDGCSASCATEQNNNQTGGPSTGSGPAATSGGGFSSGLTISQESVRVADVIENKVTVTWLTSQFSTSQVIYSGEGEPHTLDMSDDSGAPPTYGYVHTTPEYNLNPKVTGHSVTITGLAPGTIYYYRTVSRASPPVFSPEHSFRTAQVSGVSEGPNEVGGGPIDEDQESIKTLKHESKDDGDLEVEELDNDFGEVSVTGKDGGQDYPDIVVGEADTDDFVDDPLVLADTSGPQVDDEIIDAKNVELQKCESGETCENAEDEKIKDETDSKPWLVNVFIGIIDAMLLMIVIIGYRQGKKRKNKEKEEQKSGEEHNS
ncbi:DUF4215 domain-containing protein [Patescibacteria group bacterium]|nr:DUF4215 domain-containing protein [Patescibacteria group bacterium]